MIVGAGAALAAVAVAVPTLLRDPVAPTTGTLTTARSLTVTIPAAVIPLTEAELLAMLDSPPQLGPLQDPARLTSCLDGLGYPDAGYLLGARPVEINHRPAVVLLLRDDDTMVINALAVSPQCTAAHTGLLADTTVTRR